MHTNSQGAEVVAATMFYCEERFDEAFSDKRALKETAASCADYVHSEASLHRTCPRAPKVASEHKPTIDVIVSVVARDHRTLDHRNKHVETR